jgi:heat-inducible transcriptional repressor
LVDLYIETATPVSSGGLVRRHALAISSATVRNEIAELEEAGLVFRPHTSAGVVPTEQGYRYYVETLMSRAELPVAQQATIRHQFHQIELDQDRWGRLAAATLSRIATALAIVTPVRSHSSRLRALELVPLSEARAILVQVLEGGRVQRVLLQFANDVPAQDLERAGRRLTQAYVGMTRLEIAKTSVIGGDEDVDRLVGQAILALMGQADRDSSEETFVYGFSRVLNQPEFVDAGVVRDLMEALEAGRLLPALRPDEISAGDLRVVIGHEHLESFLHPYGVVVSTYGDPDGGRGTIAVLGPTRMPYAMAIPSVRYVTGLLSELVLDLR